MATGTFYIRPSADISLGHPVYPTTLSAGYLAISEKESDDSSTYIGLNSNTTGSDITYTSRFKMSISEDVKIKAVTSATFSIKGHLSPATDSQSCICSCVVTIDNITVYSGERYQSYFDTGINSGTIDFGTHDMPNLVTSINNFISANGTGRLPEIFIDITNICPEDDGKNKSICYVSQVYITLECEYIPDFCVKKYGTWTGSSVPPVIYRKNNGSWESITTDSFKSIVNSSFILDKCKYRGHFERNLPITGIQCAGTAMTGGIYCSFCGETLKVHDTAMPTVDHDYLANGVCRYGCSTNSPDRISFTVTYGSNSTTNTYYAMPNVTWQDLAITRNYNSAINGTDINGVNNVPIKAGFYIQSDGSVAYIGLGIKSLTEAAGFYEYISYTVDGVTATDIIIANNAYTGTVPA